MAFSLFWCLEPSRGLWNDPVLVCSLMTKEMSLRNSTVESEHRLLRLVMPISSVKKIPKSTSESNLGPKTTHLTISRSWSLMRCISRNRSKKTWSKWCQLLRSMPEIWQISLRKNSRPILETEGRTIKRCRRNSPSRSLIRMTKRYHRSRATGSLKEMWSFWPKQILIAISHILSIPPSACSKISKESSNYRSKLRFNTKRTPSWSSSSLRTPRRSEARKREDQDLVSSADPTLSCPPLFIRKLINKS